MCIDISRYGQQRCLIILRLLIYFITCHGRSKISLTLLLGSPVRAIYLIIIQLSFERILTTFQTRSLLLKQSENRIRTLNIGGGRNTCYMMNHRQRQFGGSRSHRRHSSQQNFETESPSREATTSPVPSSSVSLRHLF